MIANSAVTLAAEIFGVSVEDILGMSSRRKAVLARHAACYAMRRCYQWPLARIAVSVGRKNHTTIIDAVMMVGIRSVQDHEYAARVGELMRRIDALHGGTIH